MMDWIQKFEDQLFAKVFIHNSKLDNRKLRYKGNGRYLDDVQRRKSKLLAYIQRVLPHTARHAGCDCVRHVRKSSWLAYCSWTWNARGVLAVRKQPFQKPSPASQENSISPHNEARPSLFECTLPLKHRGPIELRLDRRCDESSWRVVIHRFERMEMLIEDVV